MNIVFVVNKNGKVRVNDIYFAGNESVTDLKLKKQMKGTKEKSRFTLFPSDDHNVYDSSKSNHLTFHEYMRITDTLFLQKQKKFLILMSVLNF